MKNEKRVYFVAGLIALILGTALYCNYPIYNVEILFISLFIGVFLILFSVVVEQGATEEK